MSLVDYLTKLILDALPGEPNVRAVSLLKQWESEDATNDEQELSARAEDWEATKRALDENHGSDRKLFP